MSKRGAGPNLAPTRSLEMDVSEDATIRGGGRRGVDDGGRGSRPDMRELPADGGKEGAGETKAMAGMSGTERRVGVRPGVATTIDGRTSRGGGELNVASGDSNTSITDIGGEMDGSPGP